MRKKYKWCPTICPTCRKAVPPCITPAEEPEPHISIYPCWECSHPEVVKAERQAWAAADRRVLEAAAREDGSAIVVIQRGTEYEEHHYIVDLFGLREVAAPAGEN